MRICVSLLEMLDREYPGKMSEPRACEIGAVAQRAPDPDP